MEFGYPLETAAKLVLRKTEALCNAGRPDLAMATINAAKATVPALTTADAQLRRRVEKLLQNLGADEDAAKTGPLTTGEDRILSNVNYRYLDYAGMKKRVGEVVPGHDFDSEPCFASSAMSLSPVNVPGGHPDCYVAVRDIVAG